jgi:hypothetical protein
MEFVPSLLKIQPLNALHNWNIADYYLKTKNVTQE